MKHYFVLAGLCVGLSGCGLLKLPASFHESEVARLNLIGLDFEAARQKVVRAGFTCGREGFDAGKNAIRCDKKSPDLLCPQRRFVSFTKDPKSGKVISVGTRVVDNFCLGAA